MALPTFATRQLRAGVVSADVAGRALMAASYFNDTTMVASKFDAASIGLDRLAEAVIQADGGQAFTADQSLGGFKLTNVATPTTGTDAANKAYVDGVLEGLDIKLSCRLASAAALAACTPAGTGVGKTLTADANGALSVDSVAVATGNRVLIKDQVAQDDNGIYTVTAPGGAGAPFVLTRATDFDTDAEVTAGAYTFIEEGTVNADSGWVLSTNNAITVDTTNLVFTQFTGAGMITAGAGMTKTGNTLNVVSANTAIVVNADDIQLFVNATASGLEISSGLRIDVEDASLVLSGSGVKVQLDAAGAIVLDAVNGLEVNVDGVGIEIATNALQLKDGGVATAKLANNAVTWGILASAVQNRIGRYDRFEVFESPGADIDLAVADADQTAGGILVFYNGQLLDEGGTDGYTLSDNGGAGAVDRVVMTFTPDAGDKVYCLYKRTGATA